MLLLSISGIVDLLCREAIFSFAMNTRHALKEIILELVF